MNQETPLENRSDQDPIVWLMTSLSLQIHNYRNTVSREDFEIGEFFAKPLVLVMALLGTTSYDQFYDWLKASISDTDALLGFCAATAYMEKTLPEALPFTIEKAGTPFLKIVK